MQRKVAGALVAALALALGGVAGCGGDEPKELTKAEFVRQANAICSKEPPKAKASSRSKGPVEFLTQIAAKTQLIVDGLDTIAPPSEFDDAYEALKHGESERLDALHKAIDMVKADPKAKLDGLQHEIEGSQRRLTRASAELGVGKCI